MCHVFPERVIDYSTSVLSLLFYRFLDLPFSVRTVVR